MPCVDCPALGDIAAIVGLAILVAAAAAWLTGNWLKTRFFEIALCVAFVLLLWVMVAKNQCGVESCWATITAAVGGMMRGG